MCLKTPLQGLRAALAAKNINLSKSLLNYAKQYGVFTADKMNVCVCSVTLLGFAVDCDNYEIVRQLLSCDVNVNQLNTDNRTAIYVAAAKGNLAMVQLLLSHGANPAIANTEGKTPLMIAQENGYPDIVAFLQRP